MGMAMCQAIGVYLCTLSHLVGRRTFRVDSVNHFCEMRHAVYSENTRLACVVISIELGMGLAAGLVEMLGVSTAILGVFVAWGPYQDFALVLLP